MEGNRKQNHCSKGVQRGKQHTAIEKGNGSDGISIENLPDYLHVNLRKIRKDVQCPICLGIIKKARTVMECLHSFCTACIEKAIRVGNNKCPSCRAHCPSRRSLRYNPNLDAIIHFFFPNIEISEKEEASIDEEETRNKQTQESVAHLTWGRGGARSRVRTNGSDDFDLQIHISPLESTPSLQQWHLTCRSSLTVDYVCQHVARQTSLRSEDVEILLAREWVDLNIMPPDTDDTSVANCDAVDSLSGTGPNRWFQSLDGNKTLREIIGYTGAISHNLDLHYKLRCVLFKF